MARCTPDEWLLMSSVNPCHCPFKDCVADAADALTVCLGTALDRHHEGHTDAVEMQAEMAECTSLHNMRVAQCSDANRACRGLPELPPGAPVPSASQKAALNRHSNAAWRSSAVLGVAATASGAGGALTFLIGGAGAGVAAGLALGLGVGCAAAAFAATELSNLALDPPDPDFGSVMEPDPPAPVLIVPVDELSAQLADLLNAVVANQVQAGAVGKAVVAAMERAQGAALASDTGARDEQLAAGRGFAAQWAALLDEAPRLRTDAARSMADIFGTATIPQDEAVRLRSDILSQGWSATVRDALAQLGIVGGVEERTLAQISAGLLDTSALTVSLADAVEAAELAATEQDVAAALREFSTG